MASRAANKRLTREYKAISENPPPYIVAHPSESNILEWHYIITGPEKTPYHNGQYWGTLIFPPDYPFAPPAIRMHTPSGRFQPSVRLCLSISDFHPKSFNPAWEVSTILIGLLSFMTSEEMTTGSIAGTPEERKAMAARTRWSNSTAGGSTLRTIPGVPSGHKEGTVKKGDGGAKFRAQFPELDKENWKWMEDNKINPQTGISEVESGSSVCNRQAAALGRRPSGSGAAIGAVVEGGQAARDAGQSWVRRHKLVVFGMAIFFYVLVARVVAPASSIE